MSETRPVQLERLQTALREGYRRLPDVPYPVSIQALRGPYCTELLQRKPELTPFLSRSRYQWWRDNWQYWDGREDEMVEQLRECPTGRGAILYVYHYLIQGDRDRKTRDELVEELRHHQLPIVREKCDVDDMIAWEEIFSAGILEDDSLLGHWIIRNVDHVRLYSRCVSEGYIRGMRRIIHFSGEPFWAGGNMFSLTRRTTPVCIRHMMRYGISEYPVPNIQSSVTPETERAMRRAGLDPDSAERPIWPMHTDWSTEHLPDPKIPHYRDGILHFTFMAGYRVMQHTQIDLLALVAVALHAGRVYRKNGCIVLQADAREPGRLRAKPGHLYVTCGRSIHQFSLLSAQARYIRDLVEEAGF